MPTSSLPPAPVATDGRRPWVLLFIAVCLVAVNLRMTITGVGPLLDQIGAEQGVSPAVLGLLGSVVLLAWGVFSPFAHAIATRVGMENAVTAALIVLAAGTVWRSLPGPAANLWLGTILTGLGLAIGNVLMPAVIKRDFPHRVPLVMGIYSAMLGGMGAVAAGIVVPLSHIERDGTQLGWRAALLITGSLIPVAIAVWVWATRPNGPRGTASRVHRLPPAGTQAGTQTAAPTSPASQAQAPATDTPAPQSAPGRSDRAGRRIWGDPVAWLVSLYMGTQSTIFYVMAAWFPLYQTSLGMSPAAAGFGLMTYQVLGLAGSLLLPLAARGKMRRWMPAALPLIGSFAWIGLIAAPAVLPLWILIAGLTSGAQLTMSLTLMATRARTSSHSTALSGMAQSIGYLIAGIGPTMFGFLFGLGGNWTLAFSVIWVAAAGQLIVGLLVGRPRFVLDR